MDISTLLFLICALFAFVVCTGAAALKVIGFTFGQGVVITAAFLVFGTWHPIGWGLLIACVVIRRRQLAARLEARNQMAFSQAHVNRLGRGRASCQSTVPDFR